MANLIDIKVTLSKEFTRCKSTELIGDYYTRSKNRGEVIIINICENREGSEQDVRKLNEMFKQIGLSVQTCNNLDANEIQDQLHLFVTNKKLKKADMGILIVMAHGFKNKENNMEYIKACNNTEIAINKIEEYFSNAKCPYLKKKPKLIIYVRCRGSKVDTGVNEYQFMGLVGNDCETDFFKTKAKLAIKSDLLIVSSTIADFVSFRNILTGSQFVQEMCCVFMEHAHNTHLEDLFKLVSTRMLEKHIQHIQTPEYINIGLNKHVYLNPGIYVENKRKNSRLKENIKRIRL